MWTLADTLDRLGDRLSELDVNYWSISQRKYYINESQRWLSALTRGVQIRIRQDVHHLAAFKIAIPDNFKVIGEAVNTGSITSGVGRERGLNFVSIRELSEEWPNWRQARGIPKWLAIDYVDNTIQVIPLPESTNQVEVNIAVIPPDLVADNDRLFRNIGYMEQYQGVVLNYAFVLALLKQRYDDDSARVYGFVTNELHSLGVNPLDIPSFERVRQNASPVES